MFATRTTTRTRIGSLAALTLVGATAFVGASAAPASADENLGEHSLVEALNADGNSFDKDWHDFDIVQKAATAVLTAKSDSPVAVLADGSTPLTAFIPTDQAFRRLVFQLTGDRPHTERATFDAVAGLGVDTIETVLLYHVVPGATITSAQAAQSDGATLDTAADLPIQVAVRGQKIWLVDQDEDDRNPQVVVTDINEGNEQIAHGISRVLRPSDLP